MAEKNTSFRGAGNLLFAEILSEPDEKEKGVKVTDERNDEPQCYENKFRLIYMPEPVFVPVEDCEFEYIKTKEKEEKKDSETE